MKLETTAPEVTAEMNEDRKKLISVVTENDE